MTIKKYSVLILLLLSEWTALANYKHQLKHVQGIQHLTLNIATIAELPAINLNYQNVFLERQSLTAGLFFGKKETQKTIGLTAEYGYYLTPILPNCLFLNANGGLLLFFKNIQQQQFNQTITQTTFHLGLLIKLELEAFILHRLSLNTAAGAQLIFQKKHAPQFYPFWQLGIRYRL